jgi:ankyrin repeat protein
MDFIAAIVLGRTGIVRTMLDEDPRLIHKRAPEGGWTALHLAARHADTDMSSLLISAGADVSSRYRKRLTPLFFATVPQYSNAELLLAKGADVDARGKHRLTALHCAAAGGNVGFVSFLIAHGANTNAQTDARQTAWAFAVCYGHGSVTTLLSSR